MAIFAERELIVDILVQILAPISYLEETLQQPFHLLEKTHDLSLINGSESKKIEKENQEPEKYGVVIHKKEVRNPNKTSYLLNQLFQKEVGKIFKEHPFKNKIIPLSPIEKEDKKEYDDWEKWEIDLFREKYLKVKVENKIKGFFYRELFKFF